MVPTVLARMNGDFGRTTPRRRSHEPPPDRILPAQRHVSAARWPAFRGLCAALPRAPGVRRQTLPRHQRCRHRGARNRDRDGGALGGSRSGVATRRTLAGSDPRRRRGHRQNEGPGGNPALRVSSNRHCNGATGCTLPVPAGFTFLPGWSPRERTNRTWPRSVAAPRGGVARLCGVEHSRSQGIDLRTDGRTWSPRVRGTHRLLE